MKNRLFYFIVAVFCFFILACGGGGEGDIVANTPAETPRNVVSINGNGQVGLSWEDVEGATTYHVYWSTNAGVTKKTGIKISNVSSMYYHTGLTNGTTYFYVVTAANQYGESSESQEVTATPSPSVPPLPPSSLAVLAGDKQVIIRWSLQEAGSDIISHNIYWSTSAGVTKQSGIKISNVTNPYTHENLINNTTYYYVVTSVNAYGESLVSREVAAIPSQTTPSAPSEVTVTEETNQVTIGWTDSPSAVIYNIYWSTFAGVTKQNGTKIIGVTSPYTHKGLTYGIRYYYVVAAVNQYGEGHVSKEVSATPRLGVPSAPGGVTATAGIREAIISWAAVPEATSYNIYWSTTAGVTKQSGSKISGVTSPFTHTNLTGDTTYYYVVVGVNQYGESLVSQEVSAIPRPGVPSAPSNVTATAGDRKAIISWTAVPGATYYALYWSMSSGISRTNGIKIVNVTSPYTHEGLAPDSTYYYVVTAVNAYGESLDSNKASVMIPNYLRDICVALGDSITTGYGVDYASSYVPNLSSYWGKQVYNEGLAGALSSYGASIIDSVLAKYNPKYVSIFLGVNDDGFYPVDWTIDNLRYIIRRAKAYGAKPVIATLTPVFGQWAWRKPTCILLNQKIRALASAEGITCADLEVSFGWNSGYILSDGLHPNSEGHRIIASHIHWALTH